MFSYQPLPGGTRLAYKPIALICAYSLLVVSALAGLLPPYLTNISIPLGLLDLNFTFRTVATFVDV